MNEKAARGPAGWCAATPTRDTGTVDVNVCVGWWCGLGVKLGCRRSAESVCEGGDAAARAGEGGVGTKRLRRASRLVCGDTLVT